jgi:hypothetical protein
MTSAYDEVELVAEEVVAAGDGKIYQREEQCHRPYDGIAA